jgi:hypothetical protein
VRTLMVEVRTFIVDVCAFVVEVRTLTVVDAGLSLAGGAPRPGCRRSRDGI